MGLSAAVCFLMRQADFWVIDYINDYIGVGVSSIGQCSFDHLLTLMRHLDLLVSQNKLIPPSTKVVCLGVFLDTEAGTISKPSEKLRQVNDTVN